MSSATHPKPTQKRPKPLLRLDVRDLSDEGARRFLAHIDAPTALDDAVRSVIDLLYPPDSDIPQTRSVTLVLRSMDGVAYTTGKDIDHDHKEIHFSTDYIAQIADERKKEEMLGVLSHEMVHCWQWDALGTAPGGLIEGIADWVRLQLGFAPPHWKQETDGSWDAGYQHTGYFLDFLEKRFGHGTVVSVNEKLRHSRYEEQAFWHELFAHSVKDLWNEYKESFKKEDHGTTAEALATAPQVAVEFHASAAP